MKEELEQKLFERFPFYEARSLWNGEKLGFPTGASFGDGWYDILYQLCERIEEDLKRYPNPDFCFQDIKEKYGGARFYTSSVPESSKIFDYINEAEEQSYETCEQCGTKENVKLISQGWWRTICDNCGIQRK